MLGCSECFFIIVCVCVMIRSIVRVRRVRIGVVRSVRVRVRVCSRVIVRISAVSLFYCQCYYSWY